MGLIHETRTTQSVIAGIKNFNLDHENAPYTREDSQQGHVQEELQRVQISKMVQATFKEEGITVRMSFDGTSSRMETLDHSQRPTIWHDQHLDHGQEQAIAKYLLTIHHGA